jgi:hypothetical protein
MEDVDTIVQTLTEVVQELRSISPLARENKKQED